MEPAEHLDHLRADLDRIRARAVDYENTPDTQMPPDSYLTNHQKELLERWLDDGAPFE